MNIKNLKSILGLLLVAALSTQCGEEGLSGDVDFECEPCNPILLTADLTINTGTDEEETIKAPWYLFNYKITNGAEVDVIIAGINIVMSSQKSGATVTSEHSIDAGQAADISDTDGDGNITEERVVIASVAPGAEYQDPFSWYIHSIVDADSVRYRGVGSVVGWFEEDDGSATDGSFNGVPEERFEKSFRLFTR